MAFGVLNESTKHIWANWGGLRKLHSPAIRTIKNGGMVSDKRVQLLQREERSPLYVGII